MAEAPLPLRIIFLDIDGVICCNSMGRLEDKKMRILQASCATPIQGQCSLLTTYTSPNPKAKPNPSPNPDPDPNPNPNPYPNPNLALGVAHPARDANPNPGRAGIPLGCPLVVVGGSDVPLGVPRDPLVLAVPVVRFTHLSLSLLQGVAQAAQAKIVLSTDWRRHPQLKTQLIHALRSLGMDVIGATPCRPNWQAMPRHPRHLRPRLHRPRLRRPRHRPRLHRPRHRHRILPLPLPPPARPPPPPPPSPPPPTGRR